MKGREASEREDDAAEELIQPHGEKRNEKISGRKKCDLVSRGQRADKRRQR